MIVEIRIPEVGESITQGLLAAWLKEEGDAVQAGEELFELETDKVTLAVPAEAAGRLVILVQEGETVTVGQVVGKLDTASAGEAQDTMPEEQGEDAESLSPAVRRLVAERSLDPAQIPATGKGGRLTKGDVLNFIQSADAPAPAASAPFPKPAAQDTMETRKTDLRPRPSPAPAATAQILASPGERETRVPMSTMRRRIAERMVQSQQEAAILSTFNEADMSAVMDYRSRHKEAFEQRHGVRLGLMSFFVKAVVDALKTVPQLNLRVEGDDIVQLHYYDIGVAVSTEQGLVVPVVRGADQLSFAAIEEQIASYAARARQRRLTLEELTGGSFSISNGGIFGSLLSTPILNPPQSGILGLHKIQKRPVAVNDVVVIRPMMYLAVSYDHRLVDGAQAVTFLKRVKECIESPERLLLEV